MYAAAVTTWDIRYVQALLTAAVEQRVVAKAVLAAAEEHRQAAESLLAQAVCQRAAAEGGNQRDTTCLSLHPNQLKAKCAVCEYPPFSL